MSKIGRVALEMQEELEPLGYASVGEAIADGWDSAEWFAAKEEAKAHDAFLKEKERVLGDLNNLLIGMSVAGKSDTTDFEVVRRAHTFIEENCNGR